MGENMVSSNIPVIFLVMFYSAVLPLGLFIWWKIKTGAKVWCFIAGALCFFVFSTILESLLHQFVLNSGNALSEAVLGSPVLYILYGSLAAGVFEESGRLFGYKVLLRNHTEKECAVAYGIGHGGIEVLLMLGATYFVYFLALIGIPFGDEATTALVVNAADSIDMGAAFMAAFERISSMMLHIGLSMIMFVAANRKGKLWLYPVSVLIHALSDVPAVLYQMEAVSSLMITEAFVFVTGLAVLIIGKKIFDSSTAVSTN